MGVQSSSCSLSKLFGLFLFVAWTGLSFFAHNFARNVLRSADSPTTYNDVEIMWLYTLAVSFIQTATGSVVLFGATFAIQSCSESKQQSIMENDTRPHIPANVIVMLAVAHFVATTSTNASIAFASASSAFVIKAFEPITTAILAAIISGKRVETHAMMSLPLVVIGAIGFTWRSDLQFTELFGISVAVISNIMYGIRNLGLKHCQEYSKFYSAANMFRLLAEMSSYASLLLAFVLGLKMYLVPGFHQYVLNSNIVYGSFFSGIFHVSYTVVSVQMLSGLTVVSHATANLGKRIILSTLFYLISWHLPSLENILFGGVFVIGIFIYFTAKKLKLTDSHENQSLLVSLFVALLFVSTAFYPTSIITNKKQQSEESYKTVLDQEEEQFLKVDLFQNNDRANWLSKRLPVAHDVVLEAQRIHYHLFSRLLKGYKRAVLVNIFTWDNRGDHVITIGERKILSDYNLTLEYYCTYPKGHCEYKGISTSNDLIVFVQGGGYLGDVGHTHNIPGAISAFPYNRIVLFPMSICDSKKDNLKAYNRIFKTHNDLWLLLRDRYSYDISKKSFPSTNCLLSPDAAFALSLQSLTIIPTHDIIWVKRNDWENYKDTKHVMIPKIPENITALIKDWDYGFMKQSDRNFLDEQQFWSISAFVYLARGKVVISDRLHAHLMCTLLGKPNVVVNSITRKQQNYYDTWERSITTSACVNSSIEAFQVASNLIKMHQ